MDAKSSCKPHCKSERQPDYNGRRADRCQRLRPDSPPDNDAVHKAVKLLKQTADCQRNIKQNDIFGNAAFCHVPCLCFHKFAPQNFCPFFSYQRLFRFRQSSTDKLLFSIQTLPLFPIFNPVICSRSHCPRYHIEIFLLKIILLYFRLLYRIICF